MGMFDHIFLDSNILPVSDEEKVLLKDKEWQTKSLDCLLTNYYIDNDYLYEEITDTEVVPPEERPHPDPEDILHFIGSIRHINPRKILLDKMHGYIRFYTHLSSETPDERIWYEFTAKFTDGKLLSIEGGLEK